MTISIRIHSDERDFEVLVDDTSLGAVRAALDPSGNAEVDIFRLLTAALISECSKQKQRHVGDAARWAEIAAVNFEQGAMWAVKAAMYKP